MKNSEIISQLKNLRENSKSFLDASDPDSV